MPRPSFVKEVTAQTMTILDWIEEIVFYNPVSIFLRKLGRFILREIRWIPVLWKQEEWDCGYLYNLIEFKLKELRKSISQDTWHDEKQVQQELEQIDCCLEHLDKYRNWPNYIEFPDEEVQFVKTENGLSKMEYSKEYAECLDYAIKFEEEHYRLFWDKFLEYHQNWWT